MPKFKNETQFNMVGFLRFFNKNVLSIFCGQVKKGTSMTERSDCCFFYLTQNTKFGLKLKNV
jgi:hypothetical protein